MVTKNINAKQCCVLSQIFDNHFLIFEFKKKDIFVKIDIRVENIWIYEYQSVMSIEPVLAPCRFWWFQYVW